MVTLISRNFFAGASHLTLKHSSLWHFTGGLCTRGWLGADGGGTAPTGFGAVAHLGTIVDWIIRRIEAVVGIGIDFDAHRCTESLGAISPLHARRCWGPVILSTDEHEQRCVGPVIW